MSDQIDSEDREYEVVSGEEFAEIKEEEAGKERYLLLDTQAPFRKLFPLCTQQQYLIEKQQYCSDSMLHEEVEQLSDNIREICVQYGGCNDSEVALHKWGLVDIFPDLSSHHSVGQSRGRLNDYFAFVSEMMTVLAMCETISASINQRVTEDKPGVNFRYLCHQTSILYHSLKSVAPHFCDPIAAHFPALRVVWEKNDVSMEELDWLNGFVGEIESSLYALVGKVIKGGAYSLLPKETEKKGETKTEESTGSATSTSGQSSTLSASTSSSSSSSSYSSSSTPSSLLSSSNISPSFLKKYSSSFLFCYSPFTGTSSSATSSLTGVSLTPSPLFCLKPSSTPIWEAGEVDASDESKSSSTASPSLIIPSSASSSSSSSSAPIGVQLETVQGDSVFRDPFRFLITGIKFSYDKDANTKKKKK
ncbi:uncharacterized protein MONOS_13744 [Monocercomonoides exilis]|uniref:uncharacterized protein n=1 Tax=Monocercomonoides exilis TaxID=2049356 RepID=UPI003559DB11|nr:hypothetical protein MONOS_13744 [Monocercomonoides exilis]|eukprot:MONOS_13744.1-p1 / transcript=MONOS_13744.1 / gene=MONOS_13744 / organism=Monocercomonoides_exilis_PA203 / gene_product=unspecified product / transcript_product=unspecified product / location=Mono_scaffold00875:23057-24692(-) / protein_length=419 / sequence_SO=supercontig / SO=protein_coding / is_pseudo=false